jgi:ferredoxin/flavodoxin---NADP+ reductase
MYLIHKKEKIAPQVFKMDIVAKDITRHAKAGQFVMLRIDDLGERIPMTIAHSNQEDGMITIIFQVVGATTEKLSKRNEGETIQDFVGPLGKPTEIEGYKKVLIIGGGVGCAIAYPVVRAFFDHHIHVEAIIGFKNKEQVMLENQFRQSTKKLYVTTDDGSYGLKGFVTDQLSAILEKDQSYDLVFAVGPLIMMKNVSIITKKYQIKTIVSMNPMMVDGTGMCGGCRLTVGNEVKFACVDGPDFDGHQVSFDEVMKRNQMYHDFEKKQYNDCVSLKKEDTHDQ